MASIFNMLNLSYLCDIQVEIISNLNDLDASVNSCKEATLDR